MIDVSGWLESEKLVAVKWSDLKTGEDNKIVSVAHQGQRQGGGGL